MRTRLLALILAALVAASCSSGDGGRGDGDAAPTNTKAACTDDPTACPLGALADEAGVLIGTATSSGRLDDPSYAEVISTEFNSITAEGQMKWAALQPERGAYDFDGADALVEFAETNAMAVKGHALIWEQDLLDANPDWVEAITDPAELWTVVRDHFATVLGHFGDRVDRWDVVNEPLETTGTDVYQNHFYRVLGPDYIDEMFILADEISPHSRLFLNETTTEISPAKAAAFYELVAGMVERGVPIDGVGLQAHLLGGPPEPGVIEDLITRFSDFDLEVALTELDIVASDRDDRLDVQADDYAQVVGECLAAGCREITVWGLDDGHSWLNDFLGRDDTNPLLFDADLEPKPAYQAVRAEIAAVPPD